MVPKLGSRRSDGPISRFRFCGENVGSSFVVCPHDPIFRTDKESSIWRQNDHRDIMQNLSAPFIFRVSDENRACSISIRFFKLRLQLHGAIYRPDSFVLMLRYCANLKAIRYESTSLNRIVADKSHSVIVALRIRVSEGHFQCVQTIRFSEQTKIGFLKTDRVNGPLH